MGPVSELKRYTTRRADLLLLLSAVVSTAQAPTVQKAARYSFEGRPPCSMSTSSRSVLPVLRSISTHSTRRSVVSSARGKQCASGLASTAQMNSSTPACSRAGGTAAERDL
jgi:hypothetical protein